MLKLADNRSAQSLSGKFRARRMQMFLDLLDSVPKPCTVLDIGGDPEYWQEIVASQDVYVTLINLEPRPQSERIRSIARDCRKMQFSEPFDVIYSNSLIEHLGTWQAQREVANSIQGLGRRYFVQTPNKMFPIEPHFHVPGFQFMPVRTRAFLASHFDLGWYKRMSPQQARTEVESIRLLTLSEMKQLFPSANIWEEKLGMLTKSFVAYRF